MLPSSRIMAFIAVTNRADAKTFYIEVLGLRFVSEDPFALVVESNGTKVRIGEVSTYTPPQFTVLGWQVPDIEEAVADLLARGVELQQYDFKGQDERGVWTAPSGDKVVWFKDPTGNVLSLSCHSKD
ncbi:MAG TPA: VOC family protein [Blastocatellia bacterium]|nr:VOC family protein [Blastocatellia bacterium]